MSTIVWAWFGICVAVLVDRLRRSRVEEGVNTSYAYCTPWRINIPEGTFRGIVIHEKVHWYTAFPWIQTSLKYLGWMPWYLLGADWYLVLLGWLILSTAMNYLGESLADGVAVCAVGFRPMAFHVYQAERSGAKVYLDLPRWARFWFWATIVRHYPPYRWLLFLLALIVEERK